MPFPCTPVGSSISKEEWKEAFEIAERWKAERASWGPDKALGILSRALAHLKVCYDEQIKMHADEPRYVNGERKPVAWRWKRKAGKSWHFVEKPWTDLCDNEVQEPLYLCESSSTLPTKEKS